MGTCEWYTPEWILDAARELLGGEIELDPCSCAEAQRTVRAQRYCTVEDDGLVMDWHTPRLWMNPPYGREIGRWIDKLIDEIDARRIGHAVALVNADTSTRWCQRLMQSRSVDAMIMLNRRVRFARPGGSDAGSPARPSMLVCCGVSVFRCCTIAHMLQLGTVVTVAGW